MTNVLYNVKLADGNIARHFLTGMYRQNATKQFIAEDIKGRVNIEYPDWESIRIEIIKTSITTINNKR